MKLTVSWISAGVSSFIATYLVKDEIDEIYYIDVDDQHEDSIRFIKDCEKLLDKEIKVLKSPYGSVENAIYAFGGFCNIRTGFYPCTNWLKKRVRKEQFEALHEDDDITYIWGFDCEERKRAERLLESMPQFHHRFPLIEENPTKQDAHAILHKLGVQRPQMYELGYSNNNCIGCVKGGMWYWNKIRVDFPEVFERRSKMERELNSSILKECYLDELDPTRGRGQLEIMEDCSIFCELVVSKYKED